MTEPQQSTPTQVDRRKTQLIITIVFTIVMITWVIGGLLYAANFIGDILHVLSQSAFM